MAVAIRKISSLNVLTKGIENIVTVVGTRQQQVTLSNGGSNTFYMTADSTSGAFMHVIFEWTIWVGSVANQNNFPDGSNVDPSQWIIIPFLNDLANSTSNQVVGKVYVKNVSAGGGQVVILQYQTAVIQNSLTTGATLT